MHEPFSAEGRRPVLIHTLHGSIEGALPVNVDVRTLDWLNLHTRYLPVEVDSVELAESALEPGRLGINREQIVFVAEIENERPRTDARVEAAHFTRQAILLRVADCDIQGYVHVRGHQDLLRHLCRIDTHFVAITAASVVGRDFELATNFVAVNPAHVLAVQPMHAEVSEGECALFADALPSCEK